LVWRELRLWRNRNFYDNIGNGKQDGQACNADKFSNKFSRFLFLNFFICVRDLEEIEWFEKKICGLLKKQSLQGMKNEETSLKKFSI
jgi:hypothetical protein